jgi:hypothetical protein
MGITLTIIMNCRNKQNYPKDTSIYRLANQAYVFDPVGMKQRETLRVVIYLLTVDE